MTDKEGGAGQGGFDPLKEEDSTTWEDEESEMSVEDILHAMNLEEKRRKAKIVAAKDRKALLERVKAIQGVSALKQKEAIIARKKARMPSTIARNIASTVSKVAKEEFKDAMEDVHIMLRPEWLTREGRRAKHLQRISRAERQMGAIYQELANTRQKEGERKKLDYISWKTRKDMLEKGKTTDMLKTRLVVMEDLKKREEDLNRYHERIEADYIKRKVEERERKEAHLQAREHKRQETSLALAKHWDEQGIILRQRAKQLNEARRENIGKGYVGKLGPLQDVLEAAREGKVEDQTTAPEVNHGQVATMLADKLGIYAPPEAHSASQGGGGEDPFEVDLFQRTLQVSHEEEWVRLAELESEEQRTQALYDSLQVEIAARGDEVDRLVDLRGRLEAERKQLTEEHVLMMRDSRAANRDLSVVEKQMQHMRKLRQRDIRNQLVSLQQSVVASRKLASDAEAQSLGVAQGVASLREQGREERQRLEGMNSGLGSLPLVVGRSITKVPQSSGPLAGSKPLAGGLPSDEMTMVMHASRLEVVKASVSEALKMHSAILVGERTEWLSLIERENRKDDLEATLSRMAAASERLKLLGGEDVKEKLVRAVASFSRAGGKRLLHDAGKVIRGALPWWMHREVSMCANVERWCPKDVESEVPEGVATQEENEGIPKKADEEVGALAGHVAAVNGADPANHAERMQGCSLSRASMGYITGVVPLPKFELWTISLAVTRRDLCSDDCGDPNDWVGVKLGPTLDQLAEVAIVKNIANEDLGEVRHEIRHTVRSQQLAYRFTFSSSTPTPGMHLAVEVGRFSTFYRPPLEQKGNRVLSSFVSELKMQKGTQKQRHLDLLEDLIQAEAALLQAKEEGGGSGRRKEALPSTKVSSWDSACLHGVPQRFPMETFIKVAKDELENGSHRQMQGDGVDLTLVFQKLHESEVVGDISEENKREAKREKKMLLKSLTKEDKRLLKVLRSEFEYKTRKRESQRQMIEEAKTLKGQHIEVHDPVDNYWRRLLVTDVNVRWGDNGVKAEVTHEVRDVEKWTPVGDPMEVVLDDLRWAKCTKSDLGPAEPRSKLSTETGDAEAPAMRPEASEEVQRIVDAYEQEQGRLQKARNAEDKAFVLAKHFKAKQARDMTLKEMNTRLGSGEHLPAAQTEIEKTAQTILKQGEKTDAGEATALARERYIDERVQAAVGRATALANVKSKELEAERELEDERLAKVFEEKLSVVEREEKAWMDMEAMRVAARKKKMMAARLFIPGLAEVAQRAIHVDTSGEGHCFHPQCKAWGDAYGHGVRCLTCGAELMMLHEDPRQQAGIGSGEDPHLTALVRRHRQNGPAFRFSNGQELTKVEDERTRLEKERYLSMRDTDAQFYDHDDPEMIYYFDRRHKYYMKQHGVIRQGVLWRKEELESWIAAQQQDVSAATSGEPATENKEVLLDWFSNSIRAGPLSYRTYDSRRKARFNDILFLFSRIISSNNRIKILNDSRWILTRERVACCQKLSLLHKEVRELEVFLVLAGNELAESDRMKRIRASAQEKYQHWETVLAEAIKGIKEAEMALVGQETLAGEAEAHLRDVTRRVRGMLTHRLYSTNRKMELHDLLKQAMRERAKSKADAAKRRLEVEQFRYTKRFSQVRTPFGVGIVRSFRQADEVLRVELPWGSPKVVMYVHVERVWQLERGFQQAEQVAMAAEDAWAKELRVKRRRERAAERKGMSAEEAVTRDLMEAEGQVEAEEQLARHTVEAAKQAAPLGLKLPQVKLKMEQWVEHKLDKESSRRLTALSKYKADMKKNGGKGDLGVDLEKPPGPLRALERAWLSREYRTQFQTIFVDKQVASAEERAKRTLNFQIKQRALADTLSVILRTYVDGFLRESAKSAIEGGLRAKTRMEDETGLVFLDPPHMQYDMYMVHSRWALARREDLEHQVAKWSIIIAKDQEKFEAEKEKVKATLLENERTLRADELKRARLELCREMGHVEDECRLFYIQEWKLRLRERRGMNEEERRMKQLLKIEEAKAREEQRQRNLMLAVAGGRSGAGAAGAGGRGMGRQGLEGAGGGGTSSGPGVDVQEGYAKRDVATMREQRRKDIKGEKLEMRREAAERERMSKEDDYSKAENNIFRDQRLRLQEQKRQMAKLANVVKMELGQAAGGFVSGGLFEGEKGGEGMFEENYLSSDESDIEEKDRAFAKEAGIKLNEDSDDTVEKDTSSPPQSAASVSDGLQKLDKDGQGGKNRTKRRRRKKVSKTDPDKDREAADAGIGKQGKEGYSGGPGGENGGAESDDSTEGEGSSSDGTDGESDTSGDDLSVGTNSSAGGRSATRAQSRTRWEGGGVEGDSDESSEDDMCLSPEELARKKAAKAKTRKKPQSVAKRTFETEEEAQMTELRETVEGRVRRKLKRSIYRHVKRQRRRKEIQEAQEEQAALRLEQDNKVASMEQARTELQYLVAEERTKSIGKGLGRETKNFRKLDLFCQIGSQQESSAKLVAAARRIHADKCTQLHAEAVRWRSQCFENEHRALKWRDRVSRETKFFHGRALTGVWQRWETDWIHPKLYDLYFRSIVNIIVAKAELVANERRMMRCHDQLVRNEDTIEEKERLVSRLWKDHRRSELLHLRRSELGRKIFGLSQRRLLERVWEGWVKFRVWRTGVTEAFELKYSTIKQEADLGRVYPETRDGQERLETTVSSNGGLDKPTVPKSLLQRFKERPIQCRFCHQLYLQSQNNDSACSYHDGEYILACPKTCVGLSTKCMSHRVKRWTCCDVREEGTRGSTGCQRRFHMGPVGGDPGVVSFVERQRQEDAVELLKFDTELAKADGRNLGHAVHQARQAQLGVIQQALAKERDIVKRFEQLKLV